MSFILPTIMRGLSYYATRVYASQKQQNMLADTVKGYHLEKAEKLLKSGVHPDSVKIQGQSPLAYSVAQDNDRVVDLLIKYGANVNSRNADGETPLHVAARTSATTKIVQTLLSNGANLDAQNNSQLTPAHLAAKNHRELYELLKREGADLTRKSALGRTPEDFANQSFAN